MSVITVKKGLDLPLAGTPAQQIHTAPAVRSVALLGRDYIGLRPSMEVAEGDRVVAGQSLFTDKHDPAVKYTSPGTGTIASINRGARRVLQSVVIRLDDDTAQQISTPTDTATVEAGKLASLDATLVTDTLCATGLWTAFRTRPYSKVPRSDTRPASIFVTAMDSNPLAADPQVIIRPASSRTARHPYSSSGSCQRIAHGLAHRLPGRRCHRQVVYNRRAVA